MILSFFRAKRAKFRPPPKPKRIQVAEGNSLAQGDNCQVASCIQVSGSGNVISIGNGTTLEGRIVMRGKNNTLSIGKGCHWKGCFTIKGEGIFVSIGDGSTARECSMVCMEGHGVSVGKWCMLSRRIEIRTTDAHSVIDRSTGERTNSAAPVTIGDHVWIGLGTLISKGAVIPPDCIVGAMSFVAGKFDREGLLLAGTPAKPIRTGITWARSRKDQFSMEELDAWR